MILRLLKHLLNEPHVIARWRVMRLTRSMAELTFLHGALESGVLSALRRPMTAGELAAVTETRGRELLQSLLDLGVSLGEIRYSNGQYSLNGSMSIALAEDHPVAYMVRELVQYHAGVAQHLSDYLDTGDKGSHLERMEEIIANSRRLFDILIKVFIESTIDDVKTCRILEIGCGSGEYLRYYTGINPGNRGIGIDRSWAAAEIARTAVRKYGIDDRFTIINDDFLTTPSLAGQSFDVATSYSNIYYFSPEDTSTLYARVHKLLEERGRFLLLSPFHDNTMYASYYDLIFRATKGLYPLPGIDETLHDLEQAGFDKTMVVNIVPGIPFRGIIAVK